MSLHRFLACVLSMVFAFCIFETIGYTPLAISILLLTFIPTAVMLKIQEGIVTSSVIVMHLYSLKQITWLIVGNEIAILTIGISVALLVNMYMPSSENKLKEYQDKIETILKRFCLKWLCIYEIEKVVGVGQNSLKPRIC